MQEAFFYTVNKKLLRILYNEVLYILADGNCSIVVTTKRKRILISATLTRVEEKLPESLFARVHRSYIVAVGKIEGIDGNHLKVEGEEDNIPVGKAHLQLLYKRLNIIKNAPCCRKPISQLQLKSNKRSI